MIPSGLGFGNTMSSVDWLQSVLEDRVVARTSSDWLQSDVEEVKTIDWLASSFSFKERDFVSSLLRFISCSSWFGSETSEPVGGKSMLSLASSFSEIMFFHNWFALCFSASCIFINCAILSCISLNFSLSSF